jgi:hypothetical protein
MGVVKVQKKLQLFLLKTQSSTSFGNSFGTPEAAEQGLLST